jgi:glutamyl-tRNA reductase
MSTGDALPLIALGVDHRTASLAVREALAFDEERARRFLAEDLHHLPERMVLSTCNRTEVFAVPPPGVAEPAGQLADLLGRARGLDLAAADARPSVFIGEEAVLHLLRVACGLESMVLGEAQILGQVKAAGELAESCGAAGPVLRKLLETAARAARRARAETKIGEGAVSIASAAVDLAEKVFGSLAGHSALVVGAGETGRLVAKHLHAAGIGTMRLANRTLGRAQAVAAEVAAEPFGLCGVPPGLRDSDIVVCSTSAERPILTREEVKAAMRVRRGRLLLVLDIAVPRNVDERAREIEGVLLHDIDALRSIADGNLAIRRKAVPKVEAIVEEARRAFENWRKSLAAEPTIVSLRRRFEAVREEELAKNLKRVPPEARDAARKLTESLVNRLLHEPSARLREAAGEPRRAAEAAAALADLFGLSEDDRG